MRGCSPAHVRQPFWGVGRHKPYWRLLPSLNSDDVRFSASSSSTREGPKMRELSFAKGRRALRAATDKSVVVKVLSWFHPASPPRCRRILLGETPILTETVGRT